jgi:hypothetical protein
LGLGVYGLLLWKSGKKGVKKRFPTAFTDNLVNYWNSRIYWKTLSFSSKKKDGLLHVFLLPTSGTQPDFVFLSGFNFYKRQKMKNDVFYYRPALLSLISVKKTIQKKCQKSAKNAVVNPLCEVFFFPWSGGWAGPKKKFDFFEKKPNFPEITHFSLINYQKSQ